MKRVMVDQGSGAKIMYPDLIKGLNLKPEDLTAYDSPLVSFDGNVIIPKGQIRFPAYAGSEVVEVDFIAVDIFSLHGHSGQTLATCPRGCFFNSVSESEVSIWGPN